MGLVLATAPTDMPVTIEQARAQVRLAPGDDSFDAELAGLIAAAVSHLDGNDGVLGGRCIEPQQWDLLIDGFTDVIEIPLRPLISVDEVAYIDVDGIERTLATDAWTADTASYAGWVVRNSDAAWPATMECVNAVRVRFIAGYPRAADGSSGAPASLQHAILLLVAHWFANREAVNVGNIVNQFPLAVEALIAPFRRFAV